MKEGDLDIFREDLEKNKFHPRVPARVILTPLNLTVYESEVFDVAAFFVSLQNLKIIEDFEKFPECFRLRDCITKKSIVLCGIKQLKGSAEEEKEDWVKDIEFFRDKCNVKKGIKETVVDKVIEMKKRALEQEEIELKGGGRRNAERKELEILRKKLEKLQNLAAIV